MNVYNLKIVKAMSTLEMLVYSIGKSITCEL